MVVLSNEFLCEAVSDRVVRVDNQRDSFVTVCDIYIVFNLSIEPFDYGIGNLGKKTIPPAVLSERFDWSINS